MIVLDTSAMVEALVGEAPDEELLDALSGEVHAPHLLDVEVPSALRGLTLGRKLALDRAEQARQDFFQLLITRHEIGVLADRIWLLRNQYTAYDASHIALAEALDAPLYTCDAKLDAGGHGARIRLLSRGA